VNLTSLDAPDNSFFHYYILEECVMATDTPDIKCEVTLEGSDWILLHFNEDVCYKPTGNAYPICFSANQVTKFNLDDPEYDRWFAPVAMAMVDILIGDGHTGVRIVLITSRKGIKVVYDPDLVKRGALMDLIYRVVKYVNARGWRSTDPFSAA
jgi:hypothetical protein